MKTLLAFALLWSGTAMAADLHVLTAGAYRHVLDDLTPGFESTTGLHLVVRNETAGVVQRKVREGEAIDLIVLPIAGIDALGPLVMPGSMHMLAKVGIAVAVKAGTPKPDIATVEALRAAVLAARAPAWIDPAAGGSSGIYLAHLWQEWGIAGALAPKAVLVNGGLVADDLVSGRADLGFQQESELAAIPGVEVVGPLPAAIQSTTIYAAAIPAAAAQAAGAAQLIAYLSGPSAVPVLTAKGMTAP